MSARAKKAMVKMAAELDRCEAECLATEKLLAAGLPIGDNARLQYEQWAREGKPLWRETPALINRIRKASKLAARNTGQRKRKYNRGARRPSK